MSDIAKYVIISPVRDEEAYIEKTIRSVVSQTLKPVQWIIVNDGSTDKTGDIAEGYAREHPWMTLVHRKDRGHRKAGGGVIDAFYDGIRSITDPGWNFIVKLDGDLSFAPDYFESCISRFATDPKLGVGGGKIYSVYNATLIWETHPMFHVRGATKIYRRECWDAIGKLITAPGWDTLDEVKANMMGWKTESFADLKVIHHRYTGSSDGNWKNAVKNGIANYISGYHPLFMMVKCLKRISERPFLIGSAGLFYGFIGGYIKRIPRVEDRALMGFLRKQQIRRLLLKSSIWK